MAAPMTQGLWNYPKDEAVRKILVSAGNDLQSLQEATQQNLSSRRSLDDFLVIESGSNETFGCRILYPKAQVFGEISNADSPKPAVPRPLIYRSTVKHP